LPNICDNAFTFRQPVNEPGMRQKSFVDSGFEKFRKKSRWTVRYYLKRLQPPTGMTLATFSFGFQPAVELSRVDTLGTCAWGAGREKRHRVGCAARSISTRLC